MEIYFQQRNWNYRKRTKHFNGCHEFFLLEFAQHRFTFFFFGSICFAVKCQYLLYVFFLNQKWNFIIIYRNMVWGIQLSIFGKKVLNFMFMWISGKNSIPTCAHQSRFEGANAPSHILWLRYCYGPKIWTLQLNYLDKYKLMVQICCFTTFTLKK